MSPVEAKEKARLYAAEGTTNLGVRVRFPVNILKRGPRKWHFQPFWRVVFISNNMTRGKLAIKLPDVEGRFVNVPEAKGNLSLISL